VKDKLQGKKDLKLFGKDGSAAEIKYMRRTAGYTGTDYKTNTLNKRS
jgi:hypothetical protein